MKNLKKWLFMTLIIFTMTISAIAVPVFPKPAERKVQAAANNIVFGDPNVLLCLLEEDYDTDGDNQISQEEALAITSLDLSFINSLAGLQYAQNLEHLSLYGCPALADFTPIGTLVNLTELKLASCNKLVNLDFMSSLSNLVNADLCENNISDISGLQNLINLIDLRINNNKISDITSLKGLVNLVILDCYQNNISDISALQSLENLQSIDISENAISDISSIANITSLTEIYASDNSITDISSLRNLMDLKTIILASNTITDITAMQNLLNLEYLNLAENTVSDLTALQNLDNLVHLDLSQNKITDIGPMQNLVNLVNLVHLDLSQNNIVEIAGLQNMSNLKYLYLDENDITDITPLINLNKLEGLGLGQNNISDISPLQSLTSLVQINLKENNISNISSMSNYKVVSDLDLSGNEIAEIPALTGPATLRILNLSSNKITDVSGLNKLVKLTSLDLSSNDISDISGLQGLVELTKLSINETLVKDVSSLKSLGKLLYLEARNNDIELSSLQNLANISSLDLSGNKISDLSVISDLNMTALSILYLNANPITDLSPLLNLKLREVVLYGIPFESLDVTSGSDSMNIIKTLLSRGVEVAFESVYYQAYTSETEYQDIQYSGDTAGQAASGTAISGIRISAEGELIKGEELEYCASTPASGWSSWLNTRSHISSIADPMWTDDKLEAIAVRLTGSSAEKYDIYYRVCLVGQGWQAWAMNGETAGLTGQGAQIEAFMVIPVVKDGPAPVNYTVKFNTQGGSEVLPAEAYANKKIFALPQPVRANYKFAGWNTAPDGSGEDFTSGTAVTADITVYAQWLQATMNGFKVQNGGYNSVRLSWDLAEGADGYSVYRSTKKDSGFSRIAYGVTTAGYTDSTGLTTGTTYYYRVRAYRTWGTQNTYNNYTPIIGQKPTPARPGSFKVSSHTYTSLKLTWQAVSGASGYRIYRSTTSGGKYTLIKTINNGSTTRYTHSSGLTLGKTYYYKMRAFTKVGSTSVLGTVTAVSSATVLPGKISSYTLETTINTGELLHQWASVAGATGYQIWRSDTADGSFTKVKTIKGAMSWTESNLTSGQTYYYKIRAYRTVNGTSYFGAFTTVPREGTPE